MTPYMMFVYGFTGAFAADFQKLINGLPPNTVGIPKRYVRVNYWVIQLTHAVLGGCLAVAWGQSFTMVMPLTLMAVGGGARLIIERFDDIANKMKELK